MIRPSVAPTLFGNGQFKELLRRLATGTRCARYVVVTRGRDTDSSDEGLGARARFWIGPYVHVYAFISMQIYDGETFVRLAPGGWIDSFSKIDPSFWPRPESSAAQSAKLREVTRELVVREMDRTLPKLLPTLTSRP